jgi:DNA-binding HxlR family transcriptional regulator
MRGGRDIGETRGDGGETRGDGGETRGDGGETRGDGGETRGDGGETGVGPAMNWQRFMRFLASIRGRWDLAILANLAEGGARPTDLLDAINEQSSDGHRLTWKVMRDRLRHLEDAGYVSRREVRRFPRETHYWATEFARQLVTELDSLDAWYAAHAPATGGAGCADSQ